MVVIVGQVSESSTPVVGAKIKVVVWDKSSGTIYSSNELLSSSDGVFTYEMDLEMHQSVSIGSEVIIAAWDDELSIEHLHEVLGTATYTYTGEALTIADVTIFPKESIVYELENDTVAMNQKEAVAYSPIFVSQNQKEYFHGVSIFPQSRVTDVYMESNGEYIDPYNLYFSDFGPQSINVAGENTFGEVLSSVVNITVNEVVVDNILSFDDIDIDAGLAFFAIKDYGIKEDIFNASIFSTPSYTLESAEFFFDGISRRVETEFSSFGVSITLPATTGDTRLVRMETLGYLGDDTETTPYIFELQVNNYSVLEGTMSLVNTPATDEYVATIDLGNSVDLVKVLWQVTYESTLIQRILEVDGVTQTGLLDILYQDYLDPTVETLTFEALRSGIYIVNAYAINTAGVFTRMSDTFEILGGVIPEDDINIGDSVKIACTSINNATPIMEIYRLSRAGYVSVAVTAMTQSFETTYVSEYVIEHPDSFYVFNVQGSIAVKKVGNPSGCVIAINEKADFVDPIPYTMVGFDGIEIESGVLTETGYGVYYVVMAEDVHGVLSVGNTKKVV